MTIDSRGAGSPRCGAPDALMRTRISVMPRKSDGGRRARNRYDADCEMCGARVLANAGCVEKSNDRWVVFC